MISNKGLKGLAAMAVVLFSLLIIPTVTANPPQERNMPSYEENTPKIPPPIVLRGGPDPNAHYLPREEKEDSGSLSSWDIINALFVLFVVADLITLPILIKMWFFSKQKNLEDK